MAPVLCAPTVWQETVRRTGSVPHALLIWLVGAWSLWNSLHSLEMVSTLELTVTL